MFDRSYYRQTATLALYHNSREGSQTQQTKYIFTDLRVISSDFYQVKFTELMLSIYSVLYISIEFDAGFVLHHIPPDMW